MHYDRILFYQRLGVIDDLATKIRKSWLLQHHLLLRKTSFSQLQAWIELGMQHAAWKSRTVRSDCITPKGQLAGAWSVHKSCLFVVPAKSLSLDQRSMLPRTHRVLKPTFDECCTCAARISSIDFNRLLGLGFLCGKKTFHQQWLLLCRTSSKDFPMQNHMWLLTEDTWVWRWWVDNFAMLD